MIDIISVNNMRRAEEEAFSTYITSKELMYNAGFAIFNAYDYKGKVLIICGKGNNAGDGYVLASLLAKNSIDTSLYLVEDKFSIDGKYYYDIAIKSGVKRLEMEPDYRSYDICVDAIFGIGFKGEPKEIYKDVFIKINDEAKYVISLDINSGLNADTGMASYAIKSDLTLALGYYKPGHFLNMAKDYIKAKKVLDIGLKNKPDAFYKLAEMKDIKNSFKERLNYSNKGDYGYNALIGGSSNYSGAIRLANLANCSMRAGSGVTMCAVPDSIKNIVSANILESTIYPLKSDGFNMIFSEEEIAKLIKRVKAISFGMGIGNNIETKKCISYILDNYDKALVIDADGLNALSEMDLSILNKTKATVVLTPHIKEFSRLINKPVSSIKESEIDLCIEFVNKYNVILLLKGPTTIIADKNNVYLVDKGCPGMATAGSGDVLSGILSATLGQSNNPNILDVVSAAYINGYAGELAEAKESSVTMVASDTAKMVKDAINNIIKM